MQHSNANFKTSTAICIEFCQNNNFGQNADNDDHSNTNTMTILCLIFSTKQMKQKLN